MHRTLPMILGNIILATAAFAADDPKLVAEARITETEARATALARMTNGTVNAHGLAPHGLSGAALAF
jgi:S-adenosylmethionine/arginine decarboxylase-like enzyme